MRSISGGQSYEVTQADLFGCDDHLGIGAVGKLVCLLGIVVSPVVSGFGYGILFFPLYLLQWLVLIAVTAFAFFTYLWKAIADRN